MSRSLPILSWLEKVVLFHVAVLLLGASWVYGGNTPWMRDALSVWASVGALFTTAAFFQSGARGRAARSKTGLLVPLLLFSGLVWLSAHNPGFRAVLIDGETAFVRGTARHPGWPETVSAELSLRAWWFGAAVYLSAFNLLVVVRSRTALTRLLVLIAANTFVLSIFGTLQKLASAGFYFGAAESPNPRFFATFIYYNHWGAFMILGLASALGLLFHLASRHRGRDLWHSPFSAALVAAVLIATSAPVSASRASTVMTAVFIGLAMVHGLVGITKEGRNAHERVWPRIALVLTLAIATAGAAGWLSSGFLRERYVETRLAIDHNQSPFGDRADLYRDTWELFRQKPWFGWGLNTYAISFQTQRPFTLNLRDRNQNAYATAHSDWLQSLAETGLVGTGLLVLMGIVPLAGRAWRSLRHPLTAYPLVGCGLVLAYAWVEFPFANAAVMITFWMLFFIAVRHAALTPLASPSSP
jgi:O-antigen ligase